MNDLEKADCRLYSENIDDYLDGFISHGLRKQMESHLAECETCRIRMKTYKETIELLGSAGIPDPPDGFYPSLKLRLSETSMDLALDDESRDQGSNKEKSIVFNASPSSASEGFRGQAGLSWKKAAISLLLIIIGATGALAVTWTAGYLKFERDDSHKKPRPLQKTDSSTNDKPASPDETGFQMEESPAPEYNGLEDPEKNQKEKLLKEPAGDYDGRRKTGGRTGIRVRPVDESDFSTSPDPAEEAGNKEAESQPDKDGAEELIKLLRQKRLKNRVQQDEKLQKQMRSREQTRERNGHRRMHDESGGKARIRGGRRCR